MEEIELEITTGLGAVRILRLRGSLTLNSIFDFQNAARKETASAIIVDLGGVPYMDSAGLGAILGVLASCERTRRRFAIAGASERLQSLFRVTKVDTLLPAFASVEEAEARLSVAAGA
jgi:anti-sigma B factor antagonist